MFLGRSRLRHRILNSSAGSLLVSVVPGRETYNKFRIQSTAIVQDTRRELLEAESLLSDVPSSSSAGQVSASTLVIHPAQLSALKQAVARGRRNRQLHSLHGLRIG